MDKTTVSLIWLIEPALEKKRRQAARRLFKSPHRRPWSPHRRPWSPHRRPWSPTRRPAEEARTFQTEETRTNLDQIKSRLKEIRTYARNNYPQLLEELKYNLSQYNRVKITTADTDKEAIDYIKQLAESIRIISVNKSGVITNELKPELVASSATRRGGGKEGFQVVDSYYNEFKESEGKITDYWQLPHLHNLGIVGSFDIVEGGIRTNTSAKDYLALLGVNAVSAQDATFFFLQHFSNIQKDLAQARKIVLVIPIDKIVKDKESAEFQTQCMGIWGMESMLLDISLKRNDQIKVDDLPNIPGVTDREIHIILFDNGRSNLLNSDFKDMFLCIGCRACVSQCPINKMMRTPDAVWSCKNYLWQFLLEKEFVPKGTPTSGGRRAFTPEPELDKCLHCESCRTECPLEIDLPHLMWRAQEDYVDRYGRPLKRILTGNPELLAKMGVLFTPFSNIALKIPLSRTLMEKVTGFHRKSRLPRFAGKTFQSKFVPRADSKTTRKIAYYVGCFANYYDPQVALCTAEVLRKIGREVIVPPQKCCGMPMMANDNFQGAKNNAAYNIKSLAEVVTKGYDIISTCPSCSLMIKREYLGLLDLPEAKLVSEHLWYISDYPPLRRIADEAISIRETPVDIFYHIPCHLKNQGIPEGSKKLLKSIPGISIKGIRTTCCGMGGTYGFKKEHYEASKEIGNKLFDDIKQFVGATPRGRPEVVTDCGMCQVQIESSTGIKVIHPMVLLHEVMNGSINA